MPSEKEIGNLRDESHTNSVPCFIDVFEPDKYFLLDSANGCCNLLRYALYASVHMSPETVYLRSVPVGFIVRNQEKSGPS